MKFKNNMMQNLIFSKGNSGKHHTFDFDEHILQTVEKYNYLGSVYNYNLNIALLKKHKCISPIDIMLKLFNEGLLVRLVVLYGAEVWGSKNCDVLERLQLGFCKYLLELYNRVKCLDSILHLKL